MRNIFFAFLIAIISSSFVVTDVQAKRFGGGSKVGKSFFSKKKTAPTQNTAPAAKTNGAKKAGMAGLMGGLLAGGLLGALFFGGGFEGMQFMDIILIALAGFLIFKIISMIRAQKASQNMATNAGQFRMNAQDFDNAGGQDSAHETVAVPAWFNEEQFVKGAKSHFAILQKAWDEQNWTEIASYTNDDVLAELKRARAELSDDLNTQVVEVEAQLIGFEEQADFAVVGIQFFGKIKEDSALVAKPFNETWHLTRDTHQENADWVIAGIEQNDD